MKSFKTISMRLWHFPGVKWFGTGKFILSAGLLFLIVTSCEKEYSWKLQESDFQTLVVDGLITNEYKEQCIRLSLVNSKINQPVVPVSGAVVTVSDSNQVYTFTESVTSTGSYYSTPFQAEVGKTYSLSVSIQSKIYKATASLVPVVKPVPISILWESGKQMYKYNPPTSGDPAMMEINYDWSTDTDYTAKYGSSKAKEFFYVLNNVDENKVFAPEKQIIYFPTGTRILRHQYSLSSEHQAFLRSLLMETEWRGGLFDVLPGNVISNISNGGLGFFGTSMVVTDSMNVK